MGLMRTIHAIAGRKRKAVIQRVRTGMVVEQTPRKAVKRVEEPKNRRYKMRGPTGKLVERLRQLETEVAKLDNSKRKGYVVATFFAGMGLGEFAVPAILFSSVRGAQAINALESFVAKHKNYPRVALYLAAHTSNAYLRKTFQKRGEEEIMLRQIIRGSEKLKTKLLLLLERDQMNPSKAIRTAHEWGFKQGMLKNIRAPEQLNGEKP